MIDYNNLDELSVEFEKRRVYGDPRDFDVFDGKADMGGKNCVVSEFSGYTYPELVGDPKNKRSLSVESIKDAFREFIRFKVARAPEGTVYERINANKPTFHDVKNSMMVSMKSYQMMIEGRKAEYFKTKEVYKKNPTLAKLLKVSQEKDDVIKKLNEGKTSRKKALINATALQAQITDLESAFIKEHVENHIGKIQNTITDNEIPQIPVKLHVIPPDDQRPFGALVTSGMSAYPMMAPNMAEPTVAELFMLLSPDWSLPPETNEKDELYWPVDRLLDMVKYVHGSRQWFSLGHTFGNGHPPKPFAKNTELCALLFKFPYKALPPTFCELMIGRKLVYFLQVMPIYREEMDYLMGGSPEEFASMFINSGVSEYAELERVNLCTGEAFKKRSKGTFCKKCGTIIRDIDPTKKEIKCKQCGEIISLK
jgi:hypothetical protein